METKEIEFVKIYNEFADKIQNLANEAKQNIQKLLDKKSEPEIKYVNYDYVKRNEGIYIPKHYETLCKLVTMCGDDKIYHTLYIDSHNGFFAPASYTWENYQFHKISEIWHDICRIDMSPKK